MQRKIRDKKIKENKPLIISTRVAFKLYAKANAIAKAKAEASNKEFGVKEVQNELEVILRELLNKYDLQNDEVYSKLNQSIESWDYDQKLINEKDRNIEKEKKKLDSKKLPTKDYREKEDEIDSKQVNKYYQKAGVAATVKGLLQTLLPMCKQEQEIEDLIDNFIKIKSKISYFTSAHPNYREFKKREEESLDKIVQKLSLISDESMNEILAICEKKYRPRNEGSIEFNFLKQQLTERYKKNYDELNGRANKVFDYLYNKDKENFDTDFNNRKNIDDNLNNDELLTNEADIKQAKIKCFANIFLKNDNSPKEIYCLPNQLYAVSKTLVELNKPRKDNESNLAFYRSRLMATRDLLTTERGYQPCYTYFDIITKDRNPIIHFFEKKFYSICSFLGLDSLIKNRIEKSEQERDHHKFWKPEGYELKKALNDVETNLGISKPRKN